MKKQNAITLVSLIIIVVVLLLLASVSVRFGTESMDVTRLKGFYLELETVQKRVDEVYVKNETYSVKNSDDTETVIEIKKAGADLTDEQKTHLENDILDPEGIDLEPSTFRYFTIADIEKYLDITDINYNLFINFEERLIIAEQGINIAGVDYYVLKNDIYIVEQPVNDKNEHEEGGTYSLTYDDPLPIEYGTNKCKVTVTKENIGDIGGTGYVKYKKEEVTFWNTSENNEIVLEFNVLYIVRHIDANNNIIEDKIMVVYQIDEEGNFVKDENGDNIIDIVDENGNSKLSEQNESEEI